MSPEKIAVLVGLGVLALIGLIILMRLLPKRVSKKRFTKKWRAIQEKCADETKWPEVLADADKLLDEVLRKRRVKGKTMGERMVSARKLFTDNDSVWYAHKLNKKFDADPTMQLTQNHMKKALLGLLQALKDLGAIR